MSGIRKLLGGDATAAEPEPRVLGVADDEADAVFDALSAEMRRAAFRSLFEQPATPSELAERLDTSIQNVQYHLTALEETGLVTAVGERYSEKGNPMTVYGPANDPLVFVGNERRRPHVRRAVRDAVSGIALIAAASLLVQWGVTRLLAVEPGTGIDTASRPDAAEGFRETTAWVVFGLAEPGLVFFLGALLLAVVAIGIRRSGETRSSSDTSGSEKQPDPEN